MSDSENELPSDEEDDDYVPSGEEVVEEVSEPDDSGNSEDEEDEDDENVNKRKTGERQSSRLKKHEEKVNKSNLKRGRTRRGAAFGEESNGSESVETPSKKSKVEKPPTEEEEKKRVDDLWASFLSDVNQPKAKPTQKVLVQKGTKVEVEGGDSSSSDLVSATASQQPSPTKSTSSEKITITKVFDFAGEEIKVTKEVSLDSEEAKEELAKREADKNPDDQSAEGSENNLESKDGSSPSASSLSPSGSQTVPVTTPSSGPAKNAPKRPPGIGTPLSGPSGSSSAVEKILSLGKQKTPIASGSAKSGLSNIMDKISGGPKKKLTVLDKTALDWKNFKDKEGISEELATFNKGKGGFLEKQKFLQQTDYRQYEAERNMRLGKR